MSDRKLSLLVNFLGIDKLSPTCRSIMEVSKAASKQIDAMKAEVKGLNTQLGNAKAARSAIAELRQHQVATKEAAARLAALKAQIVAGEPPTKKLVAAIQSAERNLTKMTEAEKKASGAARDLVSTLRAAGVDVARLGQHEQSLTAQIGATNDKLIAQRRLLDENRKRHAAQIGSEKRLESMRERGGHLKSAGMENMLGGAAMATPFILASKAAMDFSSGMVDIQQKAELSNQETDRMAATILRLAKVAHQLPEDMRLGVDTLAGLGLDPRQAIQMIGPIGRLGTAFKVDLADGSNAAFANLNNLKVSIADTGRALDIMAQSGNAGAFEVKDMARWFPSLTAQMQALGQKGTPAVADLAAALQIARRGAGDADQAANNIQNLLSKIQSPETIKKFQKFGIDLPAALKKAAKEGKTPLETIANLTTKATKGNTGKIGFLFEDMQAQAALRALIMNMDDFRKMRAEISKSSGTVDRAFAQREARDGSIAWRDFMGSVQRVGITLGTSFLPAATRFLDIANNVVGRVGDWAQANPQLASTLMTVASSLLLARIGLGAVQFAIGGLLGPLASVISIAPMLFRAFSLVGSGVLLLGRGIMQAGLMMLGNPIVLLITAIAAAVGVAAYLIYTHWDTIKGAFQSGVASVKQLIGGLPGWLTNLGGMMMDGLMLLINPGRFAARMLEVAHQGVTAFKNYFGIKSPSRLMMEMGGHISTGLASGIDNGQRAPISAVRRMATGVAAAGAVALSPTIAPARSLAMAPMAPIAPAQPLPMPSIMPASASGAPIAPQMVKEGDIHIHVHGAPGQSIDQLADVLLRKIEQAQARKQRGSYNGGR